MAIKKYANGSWVSASYRKYGTETDALTTLPATVIGDGTPISSYIIKGNMEQTGTPTPENPIMPSECGEMTENLFDVSTWHGVTATRGNVEEVENGFRITALSHDAYTNTYGRDNPQCSYKVLSGETYTLSWEVDNPNIHGIVYVFSGETVASNILTNVVASQKKVSFTVPSGHNYIAFRLGVSSSDNSITYSNIMLNTGSTAPDHYIPYGYKLPLTLGSTTTDIYLGEVQTTRRIKKLVLTGNESFSKNSTSPENCLYYGQRNSLLPSSIQKPPLICDELPVVRDFPVVGISTNNPYNVVYINFGADVMNAQPSGNTVDGLKEYLAQQYAAGTPVTIWYVLAEPETGIVNEPIRKIGDYVDSVSGANLATSGTAQEFDVGTALKPSEVDLTYHGWHEHEDTEFTT